NLYYPRVLQHSFPTRRTSDLVKPTDYDELKEASKTYEQQINDLQATIDAQKESLGSIDELKKEIESYKLKDIKTNIAIQAGIPLDRKSTRLNSSHVSISYAVF